MSLLSNPTVFLTVWKIFLFIFLGIFAFVILTDMKHISSATRLNDLSFFVYFLIGMTANVALSCRQSVGSECGAAAARTEMYTPFANVRRIKPHPRRHEINVNETLEHDKVYVSSEDFAFVHGYLLDHCPNAKK